MVVFLVDIEGLGKRKVLLYNTQWIQLVTRNVCMP